MAGTKAPSFVFIFTDSMGANALGSYGNALARTPTMDALAAEAK